MNIDPWIFTFSVTTVALTIWLGFWAARRSRTASDFFVAGRSVSVGWNASAISGEYLSAASFMGIAGMVMSAGYDALWYPVCYACGYLFLLLFIAGPLRRFGAYTIPDFAEGRFDSAVFRKIAVVFVLFIGFFYTMPQMKGAGTTVAYIFPGLPYWVGVVLVGAVITLNVALGGMKGITLVQAFQYWAKMFAISVPVFVLMAVYGHYGEQLEVNDAARPEPLAGPLSPFSPTALEFMEVQGPGANSGDGVSGTLESWLRGARERLRKPVQAGAAGAMTFENADVDQVLHIYGFLAGAQVLKANVGPAVWGRVNLTTNGLDAPQAMAAMEATLKTQQQAELIRYGDNLVFAVHESFAEPVRDYVERFGMFQARREALPAKAPADATWLNPFGPLTTKAATAAGLSAEQARPYSLLYTYSLIIALVCGTAGLPHILVRFYTNPDGAAAKRTTLWVMVLIGVFYVFPPIFGAMGRNLLPDLYAATGAKGTDKIVLELPRLLNAKYAPLGSILSGVTCAGAFAAFMSTFSGLLVSMTGALAHDVYGRMLRPRSTQQDRMRAFKISAVIVGGIATLLGTVVEPLQINYMVGQAFAIAAASYFPLLFMSAWWRGMTMKGAAVGMLTPGLLAVGAISLTSFSDLKWIPMGGFWAEHPLLRILCEQPAIWAVPLAIVLMIVVSKLTAKEVPADIRQKMLVLHAPEKLGLKQEYIQEHH